MDTLKCRSCQRPIQRAARGRTPIYCSPACRNAAWRREREAITLTPEQWRAVERAIAPDLKVAGDGHTVTIHAVMDRVDQMLLWAREDWGEDRAAQVLVAIGVALGPYVRRLIRGRVAHETDLFDLNRRLDDVYEVTHEHARSVRARRAALLNASAAAEVPGSVR